MEHAQKQERSSKIRVFKSKLKVPHTADGLSSYEGWFNPEFLKPTASSSMNAKDIYDRNSDSLLCFLNKNKALPDRKKLCSSSSFFGGNEHEKTFRTRKLRRNCKSSISWDPPILSPRSFKDRWPNIDDLFPKGTQMPKNPHDNNRSLGKTPSNSKIKFSTPFITKTRIPQKEEGQLEQGTGRPGHSIVDLHPVGSMDQIIPKVTVPKCKRINSLSLEKLPPIYKKPEIKQVCWPQFHSAFEPVTRCSSKLSETALPTVSSSKKKMAQQASTSDTNLLHSVQPTRFPNGYNRFSINKQNERIDLKDDDNMEIDPLNNSPFFETSFSTECPSMTDLRFEIKKFNHSSPFFETTRAEDQQSGMSDNGINKVKTDLPNSGRSQFEIRTRVGVDAERETFVESLQEIRNAQSTDLSESEQNHYECFTSVGQGQRELKEVESYGMKHDDFLEESFWHCYPDSLNARNEYWDLRMHTILPPQEQFRDSSHHDVHSMRTNRDDDLIREFHVYNQNHLYYELNPAPANADAIFPPSRTSSSTTVVLSTNDTYDSLNYTLFPYDVPEFKHTPQTIVSFNDKFEPVLNKIIHHADVPSPSPSFERSKLSPRKGFTHIPNQSPVSRTRTENICDPEVFTSINNKRSGPTQLLSNSKSAKQKRRTVSGRQETLKNEIQPIEESRGSEVFTNYFIGDNEDIIAGSREVKVPYWNAHNLDAFNQGDFYMHNFSLEVPCDLVQDNVTDSLSSINSASTYVISPESNPNESSSPKALQRRLPHDQRFEPVQLSRQPQSPHSVPQTCEKNTVITCAHRNFKRGCKSSRDYLPGQVKSSSRNARRKSTTEDYKKTARNRSKIEPLVEYVIGGNCQMTLNNPTTTAQEVSPAEITEKMSPCENVPYPVRSEYESSNNNNTPVVISLLPGNAPPLIESIPKLKLDPFHAVRIPSFELVPAALPQAQSIGKIEFNFQLHLEPSLDQTSMVQDHSRVPKNQSSTKFIEAFKNCLLPDMLPSTTSIHEDSRNIMRKAEDFLTEYRKPGSTPFVNKLPAFAAYYDLMREPEHSVKKCQCSARVYQSNGNPSTVPISPTTSNTTNKTIHSFRSQKSNRRCNLRGFARCMSFCRRNFSLRKTSFSSRFRFLFPRCCCTRSHHRLSTKLHQ